MPVVPGNRTTPDHGVEPALIRILVIGGTALFRAGLRALVEQADGLECVGGFGTLADWRHGSDGNPPDVILLDVSASADEVPESLHDIRSHSASARILALTNQSDSDAIQQMVIAGTSGVISKEAPTDQLLAAIRKIHEGQLWVDRSVMAHIISGIVNRRHRLVDDPERTKIGSLTRRELEVVKLIADGRANKAIAAYLNISGSTVSHHLSSIYEKLEVPDRTALALYAIRHNLTTV